MKVLITAFKPFNKALNNYSTEVLNYINNVEKKIIDVIYDECFYDLDKEYDLASYDLIIALGEARSRKKLTLEVQAINKSSCSIPDNKGVYKVDEEIYNGENKILRTNIDLDRVRDLVVFSLDCGKFVCNNLYYHLLKKYPDKSIFIHIPNCNDSVEEYKNNALKIEKIIEKICESSSWFEDFFKLYSIFLINENFLILNNQEI